MLLIPLDSTTLADSGISFFNIAYLGTKGVFVALLAGLVVSRLLAFNYCKKILLLNYLILYQKWSVNLYHLY